MRGLREGGNREEKVEARSEWEVRVELSKEVLNSKAGNDNKVAYIREG